MKNIHKIILIPFVFYAVLIGQPYLDPWLLSFEESKVMAFTGLGRNIDDFVFILIDILVLLSWSMLYFERSSRAVWASIFVHTFYVVTTLFSGLVIISSLEAVTSVLYFSSFGFVISSIKRIK